MYGPPEVSHHSGFATRSMDVPACILRNMYGPVPTG